MNIQFKNLIANVGEIDVRGVTVSGYFAKFGNVDHDADIIKKGAFAKTIEERGPVGSNQIMHLLNHDTYAPLANPSLLKEKDFGLYFESTFPDTTIGVDTVKLYAAGVYNEHSIGFNTLNYEMSEDKATKQPIRIIKEVKLWEGSTVTWGANEQTPFMGFKDMDKPQMIDKLMERMEKLIRAVTDNKFSDITKNQIEFELLVITKVIKSLKEEKPVVKTTIPDFKPTADMVVQRFLQKLESNIN